MKKAVSDLKIIFDMDGTICNLDHRLHFIKGDKKNWDYFYDMCIEDTPNHWAFVLAHALHTYGYDIYVVSGRPQRLKKLTESWLDRYLFPEREIILVRPDGNYEPDHELKRKWLKEFGKEEIKFVIDDRQRVVDMWREEGLVCLQCYAWREEHEK